MIEPNLVYRCYTEYVVRTAHKKARHHKHKLEVAITTLLMDLDEPKTLERWTHWLPADALPIP